MNILYETDKLKIENSYEYTILRDISNGKILLEDDFYGDPQCGLIDKDNKWAVIAGEHLTIWTPDKVKIVKDKRIQWVHSLRVKDSSTVEILVDPWSELSAIWSLDIDSFKLKKISVFNYDKNSRRIDKFSW